MPMTTKYEAIVVAEPRFSPLVCSGSAFSTANSFDRVVRIIILRLAESVLSILSLLTGAH